MLHFFFNTTKTFEIRATPNFFYNDDQNQGSVTLLGFGLQTHNSVKKLC